MSNRLTNFQALMGSGFPLWARALRTLRSGGPLALAGKAWAAWRYARPRPVPGEPTLDRRNYAEWLRRHDQRTQKQQSETAARLALLKHQPLVSVLMPTYNPRREWLVDAIESVRAQWYGQWELCIADDASPLPHVREVLSHYAAMDARIRVHLRKMNGHICATSNDALALARGEWIALLDHDDLLPPHALAELVLALDAQPNTLLAYSDEDKLGPAGRFGPYFKSDWNPELFLSQNMFSHLGMIHAELVREVGGFRIGMEGSQDYDLVLRCLERVSPEKVLHVPKVLYHWRVHEDSTASSNDAKPYAQTAAVRALREHLERTGRGGDVDVTWAGYRRRPPLPESRPKVALLLVDEAQKADARHSLTSVRAEAAAFGANVYGTTRDAAAQTVASSRADVVCLLALPALSEEPGWLEELVRRVCEPQVGLAGPMLLYSDATVASAGIVVSPDGHGLDAHRDLPARHSGHGGRAQLVQRMSAVRDACVAMRRDVFDAMQQLLMIADGGLQLSEHVRAAGLAVVWTPYARLTVSREALPPLGRLSATGRADPFYNPNLYQAQADFTLAWPPHGSA